MLKSVIGVSAVALGDVLGDALGDRVGDALGEAVQRADQPYGNAVLAENESSIARLLQSLREIVPSNIKDMVIILVTLLVSKASG